MRTKQVAERAGVNIQTLRYYERRGLLPPPERSRSGYRSYSPESVDAVRFIKRAQDLGFTLTEIQSLLDLAAGGPESCAAAQTLAEQKIADLEGKIASLRAMHDALKRLVATCELPQPQRECPLIRSIATDAHAVGLTATEDVQRSVNLIQRYDEFKFLPRLARLLAGGTPVSVDELARAGGWSTKEVRAGLEKHPSAEWDEDGRIVGLGITLRPTAHSFSFDGGTVYGWCASDALIFPVLLGKAGIVASTCPATGAEIRVEVTPERVVNVDPPDAVVSEVRPDTRVADVRTEICAVGHFFSSREAAAPWLEHYPQGQVNSVEYDFELHKRVQERLGWSADA